MFQSLSPILITASLIAAILRRGEELLPSKVRYSFAAFLEFTLGVSTGFEFDKLHRASTQTTLRALLESAGLTTIQAAGYLHVVIPEIFGNLSAVSHLLGVVVAPATGFHASWVESVLDHDRMDLSLYRMPAGWVTTLRSDRAAVLQGEAMPLGILLTQGSDKAPPGWLRLLSAEVWAYEHELQVGKFNKGAAGEFEAARARHFRNEAATRRVASAV